MNLLRHQKSGRKSVEAHLPMVTVGIDAGMFRGADHFAIQGAVDYVARLGGGTVQVLPGNYLLRNAIRLSDAVTLIGSGEDSVFNKPASITTEVVEDCDGSDWQVCVRSTAGLSVGNGITISSNNIDGAEGKQHSLHTIVGIEGNLIYLDNPSRLSHWVSGKATVSTIHSMIEAREASHIGIKDLHFRGNKDENEYLDGNYGGCLFFRNSESIFIGNVSVEDFHGDAISWQTCHDVTVENCTIRNVTHLGLHPGTGSMRPIMRDNAISNCQYGIYWCWGVRNGLAERNRIADCTRHGVTIGHRDVENIIRQNHITGCQEAGIFFRLERSAEKTAHRNLVEENFVQCSAAHPDAIGISVARGVQDSVIRHNKIVMDNSSRTNAIVVDEAAVRTIIENNEIVVETSPEESLALG